MLEPHASEKASPRGYIIISLKVLSLRWKGEQHVISLRLMSRNALKPKTISSSLLSRALLCRSVPKKQIRLKGADVPSCLCVILRRVIITICRRIKVTMFLSVPMPSPLSPLSLSLSLSLHGTAQSQGPCLLAAPHRFWPERREEG